MIRLALAGVADARHRWFCAPLLRRRAGIRIVGLSESEDAARDQVADLYNVPAWSDHLALLQATGPTMVAVSAPDSGQVTIDALRHGADVLVAPPVCQTMQQWEAITELVSSTGRQVLAVHTFRGHPAALTARELDDKLGPLGLVCLSTPAVGAHLERSILDALDLFSWLSGEAEAGPTLSVVSDPDPADDPAEIREALGELVLTVTGGDPAGPVLEVRRPSAPDAREVIQVVGELGAVEWNTRDGLMRSAIGDRPPITLSCGAFVADEWVLNKLIRQSPPAISTERSLALARFGLSLPAPVSASE